MRRFITQRWFLVTAFFALLNGSGLLILYHSLNRSQPVLAIESFYPDGETTPETALTFRFNQPMVPSDLIGKPRAQKEITFVPDIPGTFMWDNQHTMIFRPSQKLPPATPYTVRCSRTLTSLWNCSLPTDAAFTFHTTPLRLTAVKQTNFSADGRVTLALEFNDAVVPDEVMAHLTLYDKNDRKIDKYYREGYTTAPSVTIGIDSYMGDSLTVKLAKGLRGIGGPLGLDTDQTRMIELDREIKIREVEAQTGPSGHSIHVLCTQEIDTEHAAPYIQIEPAVEFTLTTVYDGFTLSGPFASQTRYRIRFLKGLKGSRGRTLGKDVLRTVVFPDLPESIAFKTHGLYLSSQGNLIVPMETVNVKEAQITIEQIYDNNLVHYLRHQQSWRKPEDMGRIQGAKTFSIKGTPNRPHITSIRFGQLLEDDSRGLYVLTAARPNDYEWDRPHQLVMITDLVILAKQSTTEILVWVNSLSGCRPVPGATVSVWTRTNQKITEAATDAEGLARFTGLDISERPAPQPQPRRGRTRRLSAVQSDEDKTPYVVIVKKDRDIAYLELEKTRRDDSPFDISGRPYIRKGYDAFVYSDRGIYRPGEKAFVRAMVRTPDLNLPGEFPVQFHIIRPDGRTFATLPARLSSWGSAEIQIDIPHHALTGRYQAEVKIPQSQTPIGTLSFQVEDFMPDRLKVDLSAEERRYGAGEEIKFKVTGLHLFGEPAAGRRVDGRYELLPTDFLHPDHPKFEFSDASRPATFTGGSLGEATLDDKGEHIFTFTVPADGKPPSELTVVFSASVFEIGGRAVTARISRVADIYPFYLGLRKEREGYAEPSKEERFLCRAIRPNGSPVSEADLEVTIFKRHWNTVLREDEHGRLRYQSELQDVRISSGSCRVTDGAGEFVFTPRETGEYTIQFREKTRGVSSSIRFYCSGDGDVPWNMSKPDLLEVTADKKTYAPGETARIMVKSPYKGRILLTVESDRHHTVRTATMASNTQEFLVPVERSFGPNVYCSATVIREVNPESPWMSHRAYGTVPLFIDPKPVRLQVEIGAPPEVRPGTPFVIPLRVRDAEGRGRRAEVTLAAVDEGICQLTRYATPDPWAFFTAKRRLSVATADVYSWLMPESDKKIGSDSEEGGDDGGYDPRLLNPVRADRVKPVSLWKSRIETNANGEAEVVLDVPPFSGQLRVMVVAGTATQFGMAEQAVLVKQPLMIQTSAPRFLAPGDTFTLPVTVFNRTREDGRVRIQTETSPALAEPPAASAEIGVPRGREQTVYLRARAPEIPGTVKFKIKATLGIEEASDEIEIPVRPPATLHTMTGVGSIPAGTTDRIAIPGGWMPETDRYWISFSSLPTLKLGPGLRYLARYPYGCVEQTTSSAFPLLYLSDLGELVDPEMFSKESLARFVEAGISRLCSMQSYRGGFSMWPGYSDPYPWGSVYAIHFLVEARKAGYPVPEENLESAFRYLNSQLSTNTDERDDLTVKAYACYILAMANRPNASWTYRLYEQMERLPAYSRFHIASALTLMKDRELVSAFLRTEQLPGISREADTGGVLHSTTREAAILLSAYMDIEPGHPHVPLLVQRLDSATKDLRWGSTQENAFALLALGKYIHHMKKEKTQFQAEVTLNGHRLASFTHTDRTVLTPDKIGGRDLAVTVKGTGTLYYMWIANGIPTKDPVTEHDNGLKVRRRFMTREGKPMDARKIWQGTVAVVEISITSDRDVENVVISDLMPAGFEIENPRIATSDSASWLSQGTFQPTRVEMRDDRLLIFTNLKTGTHVYRYVVRAVTAGTFALPPVSAECMYQPGLSSLYGRGTVEVIHGR